MNCWPFGGTIWTSPPGKLRIDKQICPVGGKLIVSEPKTKAANRTIILPPAMLEVLAEYKKGHLL